MFETRIKVRLVAFVPMIAIGCAASSQIAAQVITDGSTGAQVILNGLDVTIAETLGTRAGNNLFHSFQTFNISFGGSATFTGGSDIQNVISRVTGGTISNIQGALRSEIGSADFYFINPAGVTFGAGGSVDVPASFHLSANDELRFSDGTVLETALPTTSVLSMSTPEAFGFLSEGTGAIEIVGTQLEIRNGDIGITGNELLIGDGAQLNGFGDIDIRVSGSAVIENGGSISTGVVDDSDAGNINLNANELLIDGQGTRFTTGIFSSAFTGAGSVGDIDISITENATLRDGGVISNFAGAEGDAGRIELTADEVFVLEGGLISNATSAQGDAGDILLTANQLFIDGQGVNDTTTGIINAALDDSTGNAGDIDISVAERVTLKNLGSILNRAFSSGNAGDVRITANQILIDGLDGADENPALTITAIASSSEFGATGDSGDITLVIDESATILNGGIISTSTFTEGDAGDINLTAEQLLVDGGSGELLTGITSSAEVLSSGNAGTIEISVSGLVTIQSFGEINSNTFSLGDAGIVRLEANELEIVGQLTGISSSTASSGNAGEVSIIVAERAAMRNGGSVATFTLSQGNGGNIFLTANEVLIDGQGAESSITTASFGDSNGNAGAVVVVVGEKLTIQNGGGISALSQSAGNAGSISINSTTGSIELLQESGIVSVALAGSSDAGDITISTGGSIEIIEDSFVATQSAGGMAGPISLSAGLLDTNTIIISTSTSSPVADGGNVSIESDVFVAEETVIIANAISGSGGTITIESDAIIPFGNQLDIQPVENLLTSDEPASGNVFQAVAEDGVSVPPTVNAPETDISAAITELNANPGEAPSVASDPCAGFIDGAPSSLVKSGPDRLPITSATLIELPRTTAHASFKENQALLALNDTDGSGKSPLGCHSE